MGNSFSPCSCFQQHAFRSPAKLIFWEGTTKYLSGRANIAGELMFQLPNMVVCQSKSFYIGHPVPTLSIEDKLVPGETYFVLPIERFACKVLSVSTISSFISTPKPGCVISFCGGESPFEYLKGADGRPLIKVSPEFLENLLLKKIETTDVATVPSTGTTGDNGSLIISTPELKQHYDQLVGYCKEQTWSPKLETISERRRRASPIKFFGSK